MLKKVKIQLLVCEARGAEDCKMEELGKELVPNQTCERCRMERQYSGCNMKQLWQHADKGTGSTCY